MQANPYETIEKRDVQFFNNLLIAKFAILENNISVRMSKHAHFLLLYISSIYEKSYEPVAKFHQLPRSQFYFTSLTLARLSNIKYVRVQMTISYWSLPDKGCIDKYANPKNCMSNRV